MRIKCEDSCASWLMYGNGVAVVEGHTTSGETLVTIGPLYVRQLDGTGALLQATEIRIGKLSEQVTANEFIVTNLVFSGADQRSPSAVSLPVPVGHDGVAVSVRPCEEYVQREELLRLTKQACPTATLSITGNLHLDEVIQIASDICYALSITQGSKVNWITHSGFDKRGNVLQCSLQNRVTKPYSGLALNQYEGNRTRLPLAEAAKCYPHVCRFHQQYHWNGPILDAWLDARIDTDHPEARALKFVIVIETLRAIVLRDQLPRRHLDDSQWNELLAYLLPRLRFFLSAGLKCSRDQIEALSNSNRWEELNRKSFRSDIIAAFKTLGVHENARVITSFVHSRNKLIHEGVFRCKAKAQVPPAEENAPQNASDEFLFIASFVDRVIMQLFGLGSFLRDRKPN